MRGLDVIMGLNASDLLLFLVDASSSLSVAVETIELFGWHSGLVINWSESAVDRSKK